MKFAKAGLLIAGFVLLLGTDSFAQVEPNLTPGTIEIGNSVSFSYTKDSYDTDLYETENTTTIIEFQPRVGYFVNENFEVEGNVFFGYAKQKHESSLSTSSTDAEWSATSMGLVARGMYNLISTGPAVPYFFVGAGMILNSNETDMENSEETSMVLPEVGVGLKYFMGEQVAARAAIVFSRVTNFGGMKDLTATDISFAVGLTMFLGQQ